MKRGLTEASASAERIGTMGKFRVVVFDLDGVIVDSIGVTRAAFEFAYEQVVGDGQPAPFDEYRKRLGLGLYEILRTMQLPAAMYEPFVEESRRLLHRITVVPGVSELISDLNAAGIKLCVATGKSGYRAREVLNEVHLLSFFYQVVGFDEVASPKPAPDMIIKNVAACGEQPGSALMIGDAVADIRAAKSAYVSSAAALWGDTDAVHLVAERPDFLLSTPEDVREVVGVPAHA